MFDATGLLPSNPGLTLGTDRFRINIEVLDCSDQSIGTIDFWVNIVDCLNVFPATNTASLAYSQTSIVDSANTLSQIVKQNTATTCSATVFEVAQVSAPSGYSYDQVMAVTVNDVAEIEVLGELDEAYAGEYVITVTEHNRSASQRINNLEFVTTFTLTVVGNPCVPSPTIDTSKWKQVEPYPEFDVKIGSRTEIVLDTISNNNCDFSFSAP